LGVRRAQAITLILAMLAAPLVLLAQSGPGAAGCDRMCCLPHRHHAPQPQSEGSRAQDEEMACHRGAAGHTMKCQMSARHSGIISGRVAPFPPTILPATGHLAAPAIASETRFSNQNKIPIGFSSPPFEPPRA
jgi:hypothetical protein